MRLNIKKYLLFFVLAFVWVACSPSGEESKAILSDNQLLKALTESGYFWVTGSSDPQTIASYGGGYSRIDVAFEFKSTGEGILTRWGLSTGGSTLTKIGSPEIHAWTLDLNTKELTIRNLQNLIAEILKNVEFTSENDQIVQFSGVDGAGNTFIYKKEPIRK